MVNSIFDYLTRIYSNITNENNVKVFNTSINNIFVDLAYLNLTNKIIKMFGSTNLYEKLRNVKNYN